jgi:LEA14-like dessication related protein
LVVKYINQTCLLLVGALLTGCATIDMAVQSPVVTLQRVDLAELDFGRQTFRLSFDVENPNSFSLPVNSVSYGVKLDDQHFASGESVADFTIPANGNGEFAISVDLDLLRTAPQLLYTVRDATNRDLPYELKGKLGVNLPLVEKVSFRQSGEIRLHPAFVTRATKNSGDQTP